MWQIISRITQSWCLPCPTCFKTGLNHRLFFLRVYQESLNRPVSSLYVHKPQKGLNLIKYFLTCHVSSSFTSLYFTLESVPPFQSPSHWWHTTASNLGLFFVLCLFKMEQVKHDMPRKIKVAGWALKKNRKGKRVWCWKANKSEETTRADDTGGLWGQDKCSKYPEEQPATIILQLLTVSWRETEQRNWNKDRPENKTAQKGTWKDVTSHTATE